MAKENVICANDCSPFYCSDESKKGFRENEAWQKMLVHFSDSFMSDNHSIFHFFSNKRNKEDDMPFAQLLRDRDNKMQWFAGRWVGSVKTDNCTIKVLPRFGNLALFALLEEIFSINILDSLSDKDNAEQETFIEQLIPFIWAKKLGAANKYGIPHTTVDIQHKGVAVKGRFLVRQSIVPFFKQKNVVSATREKQVDAIICRIVLQSYKLLNARHTFPISKMTESAKNAIIGFENANVADYLVTPKEYGDIRYKSIYESWKDVVDLSWQIIQYHHISQKESDAKQGFGLFVDMAEIWESFLRKKLGEGFANDGWRVLSIDECIYKIYKGKFYQRDIIPDIILEREQNGQKEYMVFDAKYKRMRGIKSSLKYSDVDRSDLFQIHTYMQYVQQNMGKVVIGGLLYPITQKGTNDDGTAFENTDIDMESYHSTHLFGDDGKDDTTPFIIDGILFSEVPEVLDNESLDEQKIRDESRRMAENIGKMIRRIKQTANL